MCPYLLSFSPSTYENSLSVCQLSLKSDLVFCFRDPSYYKDPIFEATALYACSQLKFISLVMKKFYWPFRLREITKQGPWPQIDCSDLLGTPVQTESLKVVHEASCICS